MLMVKYSNFLPLSYGTAQATIFAAVLYGKARCKIVVTLLQCWANEFRYLYDDLVVKMSKILVEIVVLTRLFCSMKQLIHKLFITLLLIVLQLFSTIETDMV